MRIFCPAIRTVLHVSPTPAVGRVAHVSHARPHQNRQGRCLGLAPDPKGRTERDLQVRREHATTDAPLPPPLTWDAIVLSTTSGARRTCSVVNVRAPAIPPEQPDYLGR